MKKLISVLLTACLAGSGFALWGCAPAMRQKGAAPLGSSAPENATQTQELTRAYFDTLRKEIKAGESFTLTAKTSGGTVTFVSRDPAVLSVTAIGNAITVTGVKAGDGYVMAVDEDNRQYNACYVRVTATDGKPVTPVDPDPPQEENGGMSYNAYNVNTYTYPYWRGNTVYNETVLFVGNDDAAPLLYKAARILKVTSYDLQTTYTEGVDYTYDAANNRLRRTANSRIPAWEPTRWKMTNAQAKENGLLAQGKVFAAKGATITGSEFSHYIYFDETSTIPSQQVAVTYEHNENAAKAWELAPTHADQFPQLHAKLANRQNINILFYGDSVVYGANASKTLGMAPEAESYTDMIASFIRGKYNVQVTTQNLASGGTTAADGVQYFPDQAPTVAITNPKPCTITPDLLILGYGLNDQNIPYTPDQYVNNINTLVHKARQKFPNVEILIVSPTLGNPESFPYADEDTQEQALKAYFLPDGNHKYPQIATVAEVTKMHRQLYRKKGNRYGDITGNNVNHPNDAGMRLIAQTCLHTLFGADYFK